MSQIIITIILLFLNSGQVFEAEKQVVKSGVIHKYCMTCNTCNCNLDASSFYNGHDGEVSKVTLFELSALDFD